MKKFAVALLLSAVYVAPAFAADEGGFINLDLGTASFSNATTQFSTTNFGNPGAITFGGGYHFNQNLAVEAGYSIIGDSSVNTPVFVGVTITEKLKTSSFQVAAVGTLPINEKFSVFGKLGLASTKIDYSASVTNATFVPGVLTSTSGSKTNLMFGLGGQFNFNPQWGIRLQYLDLGKIQLSATGAPNIGLKITSIGGVYNF